MHVREVYKWCPLLRLVAMFTKLYPSVMVSDTQIDSLDYGIHMAWAYSCLHQVLEHFWKDSLVSLVILQS